ncbi:MAG: hypothetical protein QGH15_14880 [Kiritimatiellia bacterium]|jgi:galactokinase|nr:hypothetical protein [Kiritimatiellia bacterium]
MSVSDTDRNVIEKLEALASEKQFDIAGGKVRRTSSRFCLGVEHGDYNGTELFGVGTGRFIWMAYKPNDTGRIRMVDVNFQQDGIIEFEAGRAPGAETADVADSWARFPFGADSILKREGYTLTKGMDAVLFGNIPGGGMSRSASLSLNLILTQFEINDITVDDPMRVVDLAQAIENDYIGSPCGNLDQIMIMFAKKGMGTHYCPADRSIKYVPLGDSAPDFRIVALDTGTNRPGLEKSTYKIRRAECEELAALAGNEFGIANLAGVTEQGLYDRILLHFENSHPHLLDRLCYIYNAQQRFYRMMEAWKTGDIETVGAIFREDGIGLRDDYQISGPELETMCDIARTVPGVYGERMLGGGDKGAAGAIVAADAVDTLRAAVDTAYPRSRPYYADKFAVHALTVVDGVKELSL